MVLAGCETGTEMETETEGLAITETIIIWTLLILCQPFAPGGQKRGASSSRDLQSWNFSFGPLHCHSLIWSCCWPTLQLLEISRGIEIYALKKFSNKKGKPKPPIRTQTERRAQQCVLISFCG